MIECSQCFEHIVEFIENLLPESVGNEVASHLQGCGSCRLAESQFRSVHASMQSLVEQPTPLSPELKAIIMNSVEFKPVSVQKPVWKSRWFLALSPAFALAVVAVVWFNANDGNLHDYGGSKSKMALGGATSSMSSNEAIPKNAAPSVSLSEESKAHSYANSSPEFDLSKSVTNKIVDKKSNNVNEKKSYTQSAVGGKTFAAVAPKPDFFEMSVPSPSAALVKVENVVRKLHISEVSRTENPDTETIELVLEIANIDRKEFMNTLKSVSKTNGTNGRITSTSGTPDSKSAMRSSKAVSTTKAIVSRQLFMLRILKLPDYAP